MPNQFRVVYDDFDGDAKTTSIAVRDEPYSTQAAKLDTFAVQLDLWAGGRNHRVDHILNVVDNGPGRATSPVAQGSTTAVLEIQDTVTGIIYREKLPMPNLVRGNDVGGNSAWIAVGQGQNSLTIMNPEHAGWATFKAAYDAIGVSAEGNDAVLVRAYIEE
jgi:hypothetical protein